MIIKTKIKAGHLCDGWLCGTNHNEKLASDKDPKSLIVKTGVKAGQGKPPIIK